MSRIRVIGLGALNVDHLYRVERILVDGEALALDRSVSPGGSAANTTYALARLGIEAGFVGAVGDDEGGRLLLDSFRKGGVDASHVSVKSGARTGAVLAVSDRLGHRSLYVSPGANDLLSAEDINPAYLEKAEILHLSSFASEAQFRLSLDVVGTMGSRVKVSFAPGSLYTARGLEALAPILRRTSVLFTNRKELHELTGQDIEAGTQTCLDLGCQVVVVTLDKGIRLTAPDSDGRVTAVAYIRDAANAWAIGPPPRGLTPVADSTGAGDAFAAGFLFGLLNSRGIEECGRLGDLVARFSLAKAGARTGLPTLRQLTRRYRDLYGQLP